MRRNRKGSMELSVNSIVILVIAVVVMGLILGFIRTKFKEVGGNMATNEPEPLVAGSNEPITLSKEVVSAIPNGKALLKINVYNPTLATISKGCTCVSCVNGATAIAGMTQSRTTKDISAGEQVQFLHSLDFGSTTRQSYLCNVKISDSTCTSATPTCDDEYIANIPAKDFVLQIN